MNDISQRIASLRRDVDRLTQGRSPEEADEIAAAQARADSVAALFGQRALPAVPGETSLAYRKRLLQRFLPHCPRLKDARLDGVDSSLISQIEDIAYADATAAARSAAQASGQLLAIQERDASGRLVTRFEGDPLAWMAPFMTAGAVGRFNRSAQ